MLENKYESIFSDSIQLNYENFFSKAKPRSNSTAEKIELPDLESDQDRD